jgi:hypothetical protein
MTPSRFPNLAYDPATSTTPSRFTDPESGINSFTQSQLSATASTTPSRFNTFGSLDYTNKAILDLTSPNPVSLFPAVSASAMQRKDYEWLNFEDDPSTRLVLYYLCLVK